jgi:hypothetical protein
VRGYVIHGEWKGSPINLISRYEPSKVKGERKDKQPLIVSANKIPELEGDGCL